MIVDSHCHLHDPAFADVRGTVIRATEHNVWGARWSVRPPPTSAR
jgi:Tat protein secretion system quality control protein TatD with DNase activity